MSVAMIGVPDSSASLAALAASRLATRSLTLRDSFSSRGDRLLDGLEVGEDQLGLDGGDVVGGVDLAVDVGDVLVAEDAGDLADRGGLADVGEELVAQALALRGAARRCRRCRRTRRVAGSSLAEPKTSASCGSRSSGTPTTPTLGSIVANG